MVLSRLDIDHGGLSLVQFNGIVNPDATNTKDSARRLSALINSYGSGTRPGAFTLNLAAGSVKAFATVTFTDTRPVENELVTICGTAFTAKDSGATGNEFNTSATDGDVTAAALVVAINSSATARVTESVVATAVASVVTITALVTGTLGNALVLTENLANTTNADFSGGSEGTVTNLPLS